MTFKSVNKDKKSAPFAYRTDVAKMGDSCDVNDNESSNHGFTWVHGN